MKGSSILSKLRGNSSRGFKVMRNTEADIQAKAQAEHKIAEIQAQDKPGFEEDGDPNEYQEYIQVEIYDCFDGFEHEMKLKTKFLEEMMEEEKEKNQTHQPPIDRDLVRKAAKKALRIAKDAKAKGK